MHPQHINIQASNVHIHSDNVHVEQKTSVPKAIAFPCPICKAKHSIPYAMYHQHDFSWKGIFIALGIFVVVMLLIGLTTL